MKFKFDKPQLLAILARDRQLEITIVIPKPTASVPV